MYPAPVRRKPPVRKPKSTPKAKDVEVIEDAGNTFDAVSPRGYPKKTGPAGPPAVFSVSISVIHKQYIIRRYASMHQAGAYNFAAYMDTESTKVNNWSQRKRLRLTRSGKATISCDLKSSQPLGTVADGLDDYKAAEGIAVAWVNEGKKGAHWDRGCLRFGGRRGGPTLGRF